MQLVPRPRCCEQGCSDEGVLSFQGPDLHSFGCIPRTGIADSSDGSIFNSFNFDFFCSSRIVFASIKKNFTFIFLATLCGMHDPSSPARNQTLTPGVEV